MNKLPDFQKTDLEYAYDGELGAIYSDERTEFRVWSPYAEAALVKLYPSADSTAPCSVMKMKKSGGGWSASVPGDLHGAYYTYEITNGGVARETIDIYARAAGANGVRGMVVDLSRTDPDGWAHSQPVALPDYTDAVIYELHVRDFSSDESGNFKVRGKFVSFCEKDPVNDLCEPIGLEHIRQLGMQKAPLQGKIHSALYRQ